MAGPPSPEKFAVPLPAKVEMVPNGINLANAVVVAVDEIQISLIVGAYLIRIIQFRAGGRTAIAAKPSDTGSGYRGDNSIRSHFSNPLISRVRDE